MKLLVVGASTSPVCGVRDCATVLTPALRDAGASVEVVWWDRDPSDGLRETLRGASALAERALASAADAIVWHFTAFAYGPRGLPVATAPLARRLAEGPPLVPFLHELVYPWQLGSTRGLVHAATQRAALRAVIRSSAALVVTTDDRARWLRTRAWLPSRPLGVTPVPSNIRVAGGESPTPNGALHVGIFGFGTAGNDTERAVRALAQVRRRGIDARLTLLGAPGAASPQAEQWRRAAARAGCAHALGFTGVLAEDDLSRHLGALDLVLVPDRVGPTARRGTLAAALAHGRPVLGLDGGQRWVHAVASGAIAVARPDALAGELERLARDAALRRELGRRARAFYEETAAAGVVARILLDLVTEAVRR